MIQQTMEDMEAKKSKLSDDKLYNLIWSKSDKELMAFRDLLAKAYDELCQIEQDDTPLEERDIKFQITTQKKFLEFECGLYDYHEGAFQKFQVNNIELKEEIDENYRRLMELFEDLYKKYNIEEVNKKVSPIKSISDGISDIAKELQSSNSSENAELSKNDSPEADDEQYEEINNQLAIILDDAISTIKGLNELDLTGDYDIDRMIESSIIELNNNFDIKMAKNDYVNFINSPKCKPVIQSKYHQAMSLFELLNNKYNIKKNNNAYYSSTSHLPDSIVVDAGNIYADEEGLEQEDNHGVFNKENIQKIIDDSILSVDAYNEGLSASNGQSEFISEAPRKYINVDAAEKYIEGYNYGVNQNYVSQMGQSDDILTGENVSEGATVDEIDDETAKVINEKLEQLKAEEHQLNIAANSDITVDNSDEVDTNDSLLTDLDKQDSEEITKTNDDQLVEIKPEESQLNIATNNDTTIDNSDEVDTNEYLSADLDKLLDDTFSNLSNIANVNIDPEDAVSNEVMRNTLLSCEKIFEIELTKNDYQKLLPSFSEEIQKKYEQVTELIKVLKDRYAVSSYTDDSELANNKIM